MRTLITALALTAILATCAVAKTPRHKEVRVQPNNSKPQRGEAKPHPNQFVLPLRSRGDRSFGTVPSSANRKTFGFRGRSTASTSRRFGRPQPVIFSTFSLMLSMRGMCNVLEPPSCNAPP